MHTFTTVAAMQAEARRLKAKGQRLALVPTMGALHDGHLALVQEAKKHADHVAVSIFVNPTQFGPNEDFNRYPRDLGGDMQRLETVGCDAVFAPTVEEMYPFGQQDEAVWVTVEGLDDHLDGPMRPGHFRGVTTVVAKLFHACQPDVAVFGQKDAQQLAILRRMTRALLFPVQIVGLATVRDADGLALSSRNRYLTADERAQAPVLHRALQRIEARVAEGERRTSALIEAGRSEIAAAPLARIQYVAVVDAATLAPVETLAPGQKALAALAVHFGTTRLIDNVSLSVPA
ncbi:MAG: pantoate--beta-alanine ligase [Rhodothermales bacterium]|nr:pantoate--beta-alanine ligase [Rhodothermales bacterium]